MATRNLPYTHEERMKIVQFIIDKDAYSKIKGDRLWREMEESGIVNRTWQSLKQHFRKTIICEINRPRYKLDRDVLLKFFESFNKIDKKRKNTSRKNMKKPDRNRNVCTLPSSSDEEEERRSLREFVDDDEPFFHEASTSSNEPSTSNNKTSTSNNEPSCSNNKTSTLKNETSTSNDETSISDNKTSTSNNESSTSNDDTSASNNKPSTSYNEPSTSNNDPSTSNNEPLSSNEPFTSNCEVSNSHLFSPKTENLKTTEIPQEIDWDSETPDFVLVEDSQSNEAINRNKDGTKLNPEKPYPNTATFLKTFFDSSESDDDDVCIVERDDTVIVVEDDSEEIV